ncbi:MAG: pyridoxal-phosphate-dependent aminotransferase family protein, partial [Vulcanimicrobiaceae bacterium]
RVVRGMAPIFGTSGEIVALGGSGTGGLQAAVASSFSPGERVLAAPVGIFGERLAAIARAFGLEVELLETRYGSALDPEALAARLRADREQRIAGVLLTHNETSTGVQNDLGALAAAFGEHPALRIVDSVSGLGATPFAMDAWGYDIVVTASQKVLAAPPGLALVAASARAWERIAAARGPRFYFDLAKARQFAHDGQTPWTPPLSILAALEVGLERYHAAGAAAVYARLERYARAIRSFAETLGIELFSRPGAHSVTVVALRVPPGLEAGTIRTRLRERGIVFGGGQGPMKGKILRIGTMGDLSDADLLAGLEAFETVLCELGLNAADGRGLAAAHRVLSATPVTA